MNIFLFVCLFLSETKKHVFFTYVFHEPFERLALEFVADGHLVVDVAEVELSQMRLTDEEVISATSHMHESIEQKLLSLNEVR